MGKENELRTELCEIGKRAYSNGYVAANDGNFSVRLGDNEFLCTPTGVSKGFMTPEMMCKVNAEGALLEENGHKPSSEIKMHLRVYKHRDDVNAVVHTHSPYATTFAASCKPLNEPIMTESIVLLWCVPLAEYAEPSTEQVPASIEKYLKHFDAALLANHGAITWGSDLTDAWYKTESAEHYAKITTFSKSTGGGAPLSPEKLSGLYGIRRRLGFPVLEAGEKCPGIDACGVCHRQLPKT